MTTIPITDEMIERAARAIRACQGGSLRPTWEEAHQDMRQIYYVLARAALEAALKGD
jgi:hypothetical protein